MSKNSNSKQSQKRRKQKKRRHSPHETSESRTARLQNEMSNWLTSAPISSSPFAITMNAAEGVELATKLNISAKLDELLVSLMTILSAMHASAGQEYPDDMKDRRTPTEEDVKRAYGTISFVVHSEPEFACLWDCLRKALGVIDAWRERCGHYDDDDDSGDEA